MILFLRHKKAAQTFVCAAFFLIRLYQGAVPNIYLGILENFLQPMVDFFLGNALLQDHLQEAAATCTADHSAVDQVGNAFKNLVDQSAGTKSNADSSVRQIHPHCLFPMQLAS